MTYRISIQVGNLAEWKLRREVISSGLMLYGKYAELPETEYYALFTIVELAKKKSAQQIKIFRAPYGYKQRIEKKTYEKRMGFYEVRFFPRFPRGEKF